MTTGGKRGRRCSVCAHPARAAIDAALLAGQTQADLARTYRLSHDAISRHRLRHLSVAAVSSSTASVGLPVAGSVDLLGSVADLQSRLMRLLRRAESAQDLRTALLAIREAARLLELHGRLTGEIAADGTRIAVAVTTGAGPDRTGTIRERIAEKLAALSGGRPTPTIDATAE